MRFQIINDEIVEMVHSDMFFVDCKLTDTVVLELKQM